MFTYEIKDLDQLRRKFDPKLVDKALNQALQVATTKLRTRVSRETRQLYNVKAGEITRSVTIRKISNGRMLIYTGRMIGLDKFGARPKKVSTQLGKRTGVTVQVRKDRGRKVVKGAFLAKGKLVFQRQGEARLPIERLYGPSIAHMAGNKIVGELATLQVGQDAATEFNRYLTYLMEKA